MVESKEFSGKQYKWYDSHKYKATAQKEAWKLRQDGFWARIIKTKRKGTYPVYRIFIRGK